MAQYSDELKAQVIKEFQQIDNVALVARRHDIAYTTVYTWLKKTKKNGSIKALPKDVEKQLKAYKKRVNKLGTENDQLKKLLTEKELELAILRDLRDSINPE
ncbi:MAG: transposase [Firmicutes bacterium]|nr:transposase [Bacillota bacterium]